MGGWIWEKTAKETETKKQFMVDETSLKTPPDKVLPYKKRNRGIWLFIFGFLVLYLSELLRINLFLCLLSFKNPLFFKK